MIRSHCDRRRVCVRTILIALSILPLMSATALAQPQPGSMWVTLQDTLHLYRMIAGDTVPPEKYSAAYSFEMVYDSVCHVNYLFTECRKNRDLLKLLHWQYNRLVHADARYLTYNSRTAAFTASAGDTISFFRELRWYHPFTQYQDTSNYFALDTLEFMAYLVNARTGAPLIRLDSIGAMPRLTVGPPAIYGMRPLMAVARTILPASFTTDSVFIGITVRAEGSGAHQFSRLDHITIGVSERLNDPFYIEYLRIFSGLYAKRNATTLTGTGGGLSVRQAGGSPREIIITVVDRPAGPVNISVHDAAGELVFTPYSSPAGDEPIAAHYRFDRAGAYFFVLGSGDRVLGVEKITIP